MIHESLYRIGVTYEYLTIIVGMGFLVCVAINVSLTLKLKKENKSI